MLKEKGKSHPFAGHLRQTEDILWMSEQANTITLPQAIRMGLALDIGATISITLMMGIKGYFDLYDIRAVVWIAVVILFLCAPIAAIMMFFVVRAQNRTRQTYAVTNERLLHRTEQEVKTIPLNHVLTVSVFQEHSTKGALNFGPLFPMWSDVENAAGVKKIIEDAKTQQAHPVT